MRSPSIQMSPISSRPFAGSIDAAAPSAGSCARTAARRCASGRPPPSGFGARRRGHDRDQRAGASDRRRRHRGRRPAADRDSDASRLGGIGRASAQEHDRNSARSHSGGASPNAESRRRRRPRRIRQAGARRSARVVLRQRRARSRCAAAVRPSSRTPSRRRSTLAVGATGKARPARLGVQVLDQARRASRSPARSSSSGDQTADAVTRGLERPPRA